MVAFLDRSLHETDRAAVQADADVGSLGAKVFASVLPSLPYLEVHIGTRKAA